MNRKKKAEVTVALKLNQGEAKETGCILFLSWTFFGYFLSFKRKKVTNDEEGTLVKVFDTKFPGPFTSKCLFFCLDTKEPKNQGC